MSTLTRPPRPLTLTRNHRGWCTACVCGWSLTHDALTVDLPALRATQRHVALCDQYRAARVAEIDWAAANDTPAGTGHP